MMWCRFLNPSSFQKLYKLATPFFHSPGMSLKDLTKLLLSEYVCRTTGIVLLCRAPVVGTSILERSSTTGLRHTLHRAILTDDMLTPLCGCLNSPRDKFTPRRLVLIVSPPDQPSTCNVFLFFRVLLSSFTAFISLQWYVALKLSSL